ncbi:AAA family ATPase [Myroides marinus]|uniref:McrB family protein n=1 Tax=Myroides marinus TaxID=703342 RepID=UPI002574DF09|nr:AAA family ATPase [Myroides marinus]MDM1503797.1 AAA family ATPase [Myroides marinus]
MNLIFTKNIELQDAKYRLVSNNNNETSIFIPKDNGEAIGLQHDEEFTFYLNKENVLYTLFNTFNYSLDHTIFEKRDSVRIDYKKIIDIVDILKPLPDLFAYKVKVSVNGNRFYLKELRQENKLNIRDIIIGGLYEFNFYKDSENQIHCKINLRNNLSEESSNNDTPNIILEDKVLKNIIYLSFKYLLENYNQDYIFKNSEIIDRQIEGLEYKGLVIRKYFNSDVFIGLFNEVQTDESLKSGGRNRFVVEEFETKFSNHSYFTSQWYDDEKYKTNLNKFNDYLNEVSNCSLKIIKEEGIFKLIKIDIVIGNTLKFSNKQTINSNTIYYGAPGTGKSYKVDQIIKDLDKQFYERITFHPEYDNASFIGGYKPVSEKDEEGKDVIKYEFVPQAFANIYKRAWQDLDNQYYLVIEEINRGNCAEIFGELFQLLDRNSGYTIAPSNELYKHLVEEFGDENHEGIAKGLKLPPNLAILATMNTSDQSLFPMDSAFKRRWEWEYVPICYDEVNEQNGDNNSYNFTIFLNNGSHYRWIDFIKIINKTHIAPKPNLGMDKCIGNYFVKPENGDFISLKQFINKVIFYLWNDVFKDEDNIVFEANSSYEDFFPINTNGLKKVTELFERIGLEKLDQNSEEQTTIDLAAEPQEPYGE